MVFKKGVFCFLSEFLCSMNLVAFMCLACSLLKESMLALSFTYGLVQFILICVFGPVSGAHVNPAISLALWIRGLMSFKRLLIYVIAQIAGGIFGRYVANKMLGKLQANDALCLFSDASTAELSNAKLMGIEFWLTFFMITMCMGLWEYKGKLPIELFLAFMNILICLLSGHLTGASTNPAHVLAPVLFTEKSTRIYYLVAGQLLAGIAAPWLWGLLDK